MSNIIKAGEAPSMFRQLVRYCLVGVINTFVGLSIIYVAMGVFLLAPALSNMIGFAVGILVSYTLNRRWTFSSNAPLSRSMTIFGLVCLTGYILNLSAVLTAIHIGGVNPYLAQLFGISVYTVSVFLGSRQLAFRR
ncbi:GtrA family protein [Hyphococcus flavus]|uniref:GtrA family protein n=1 Tax=Hyphococcus flavus TaxID=1866326 RepID=A0AAE9ZD41_9PROT|nr:GtrA family protein [Hyphococcus flavus]WDI30423.1 GtrA family protein [Hyphococcus flavus]